MEVGSRHVDEVVGFRASPQIEDACYPCPKTDKAVRPFASIACLKFEAKEVVITLDLLEMSPLSQWIQLLE